VDVVVGGIIEQAIVDAAESQDRQQEKSSRDYCQALCCAISVAYCRLVSQLLLSMSTRCHEKNSGGEEMFI
jgi:hypothetical protein